MSIKRLLLLNYIKWQNSTQLRKPDLTKQQLLYLIEQVIKKELKIEKIKLGRVIDGQGLTKYWTVQNNQLVIRSYLSFSQRLQALLDILTPIFIKKHYANSPTLEIYQYVLFFLYTFWQLDTNIIVFKEKEITEQDQKNDIALSIEIFNLIIDEILTAIPPNQR